MRTSALIAAFALLGGSATVGALDAPSPPTYDTRPDATLQLSEGRLSTGLDYMWGRGQLKFRDGRHAFHISGAPVVDGAALRLSAVGKVYHLTQLSEFSGTYSAVNLVGLAYGDGSTVPMRNEHGVVLVLHVADTNARGNRPSGNVRIQLKE